MPRPYETKLAGYDERARPPDWDALYPSSGSAIAMISHDSSKRLDWPLDARQLVLVYQCGARFSRQYLEDRPSVWEPLILEDVRRLVSSWAGQPVWTQAHRWRLARMGIGDTLSSPICITLPGGLRLGLAGEAFAPPGGAEGAFLSGRRLANILLGDDKQ